MGLRILTLLILAFYVHGSTQQTNNLPHVTGCGCTTTTTCSPAESCESNQREISRLQTEVDRLNDDLQVYWNLSTSYPSSCSEYIRHENERRKFERVPLFTSMMDGSMIPVMANCTRLEEIHGSQGSAAIDVPLNSVTGRTLKIKGTPVGNVMGVNFGTDSSAIFFHMAVRFLTRVIVRNDFNDGWKTEEQNINGDFPFRLGVPFTMKITVDHEGYHCEVDGRKIFTFVHRRMPLSDIQCIDVSGTDISFMSFN